jgi:hypothetical protein
MFGAAYSAAMAQPPGDKTSPSGPPIEAVIEADKPRLLSLDGVVGVGRGLCRGRPCVKVMVLRDTPELAKRIGRSIEGFEVEIIEIGPIRAN